MDTYTAGDVARLLNVSTPTVRRAAATLSIAPQTTAGGHRRFTEADVADIRRLTGFTPTVDGLTRSEVKTLAALARHPNGLRSNRAVARAASLSPTAAGRATTRLRDLGLASRTAEDVAEGSVATVEVWRLTVGPAWFAVADEVSRTVFPERPAPRASGHVPPRFWHQFWNVDPRHLDTDADGAFIALRLVSGDDPAGRAWALRHLDADALDAVRQARGMDVRLAAMVDNALAARR